ncbi:hypothetical protein Acsp07_36900 [Actinomycetospora sp. NBRC 106378]|nr:hypothetical protein Acsp07_36900 [Actinomycetospora sp. NBRC 106378]
MDVVSGLLPGGDAAEHLDPRETGVGELLPGMRGAGARGAEQDEPTGASVEVTPV